MVFEGGYIYLNVDFISAPYTGGGLVKGSNSKQIMILMIVIILSLGVSALFLVNKEYETKYKDYTTYRNETFDNTIDVVVRTYERFSNFIFASVIDNDQIKVYLYEANHGDEMVKAEVRKQLASELQNTHELITKHNFRQFHFQLANGDSFYRFHNPDKFGDNLLDIRESMRIANIEQKSLALREFILHLSTTNI